MCPAEFRGITSEFPSGIPSQLVTEFPKIPRNSTKHRIPCHGIPRKRNSVQLTEMI